MHFYFDECGMTGLMFTEILNYKRQLLFVSVLQIIILGSRYQCSYTQISCKICMEFWTYISLKCGKKNLLWLAKIIITGVLHECYEANCLTVPGDNQNSVLSHSFIHLIIPLFSIYPFTRTTYGCGNLYIMQHVLVSLDCDKNANRTNVWN